MPDAGPTTLCGIILAGMPRWGDTPFERLLPRPLMPVADSPLVCYGLRWLRDGGIRASVVCANGESRLLRRCLGDGSAAGLSLHYYEDLTPRGPAGCIRDAGQIAPADEYVVVEGSVVPACDLAALLATHRKARAAVTVAATATTEGGAGLQPSGIYVLSQRALAHVSPAGYQDLKEVLIPKLYRLGEPVAVQHVEAGCPRVTDASSYLAANAWLLRQMAQQAQPPPGYGRRGQACVHKTARVAPDVRLIGPVLVGPDTTVAGGTTLVGPTTLGAGCSVGPRAVLSRSVIWDGCRIGPAALLDQFILPVGTSLAGGACLRGAARVDEMGGDLAAEVRERTVRPAARPGVGRERSPQPGEPVAIR